MRRIPRRREVKVWELVIVVLDFMRAGARWVLLTMLFALSNRWRLDGLEIVDVAGDDSQVRENLRSALALIATVDPRRYRRLRRDLQRIVVLKSGGPEFASEVGACILPSGYVRRGAASAVATTMVHEATHARLWHAGIRYHPGIRARVEAACVKQQIAFASLLGDEHILAHLRRKLETPWWTAHPLRYRQARS